MSEKGDRWLLSRAGFDRATFKGSTGSGELLLLRDWRDVYVGMVVDQGNSLIEGGFFLLPK